MKKILFSKMSINRALGWSVVWLLALYFIYTNALRYFNPSFKGYTLEFKPFVPFMVAHVAGGMIALLIGPFQFFPTIRKKYTNIHKIIGKVYLLCVLFSVISATYLAVFDNLLRKKEFMFGTGAIGMAMAWFITGSMAYWAIKKRNFIQHQEWMIRSYVLTCNFIIFRLIFYGLLGIETFPFKSDVGGFTAWAGWSVPLLITEFVIQFKKINVEKNNF